MKVRDSGPKIYPKTSLIFSILIVKHRVQNNKWPMAIFSVIPTKLYGYSKLTLGGHIYCMYNTIQELVNYKDNFKNDQSIFNSYFEL